MHFRNYYSTLPFRAFLTLFFSMFCFAVSSSAATADKADTALIVSVDVSNSVDAKNYRLQMEGIAAALESPEVIQAILSGPTGTILFSLVTWSSDMTVSLPLTRIASRSDATEVATRVRETPRDWKGGEFTCIGKMLGTLGKTMVQDARNRAMRTVIDISGDGPDNCSSKGGVKAVRDWLVDEGAIINGLPILTPGNDADEVTVAGRRVNSGRRAMVGRELEDWYRSTVQGGPGSFVLSAQGFEDFARAIRRKFVLEMSYHTPVTTAFGAAPRDN